MAISTWLISRLRMWRRKNPEAGVGPNMSGSGYLLSCSGGSICGRLAAAAAGSLDIDVGELDVFDRVAGMPLRIELMRIGALWQSRLLMRMRFRVPTLVVSLGPRRRAPRRMKIGPETRSRMVMLVMVMSSSSAPSTVSSAKPWQPSKTQFEMVMLMKPPLDSVPHLMRPVP